MCLRVLRDDLVSRAQWLEQGGWRTSLHIASTGPRNLDPIKQRTQRRLKVVAESIIIIHILAELLYPEPLRLLPGDSRLGCYVYLHCIREIWRNDRLSAAQ